ncbi:methyltransferase domain-containing protein [Rhizomonospora bruguierae]|uniref:methyltransferase domain-containing protein n=1 Tax=Rhizomonospora bruguierae TaxID=1581705 RepID=UPI001BCCE6BE|nr:methyltransferase domain-containing protein [Micromonospora sp. NBRC 107566]
MFVEAPSQQRLGRIDRHLGAAFADAKKHDDRLRPLAVDARFDGGVAHLTGAVADPGELRLVRDLVGRLDGVFAVWSRVHVGGRAPVLLDVGCGQTKQYPEAIGLDMRACEAVDVRANLSLGLPMASRSVDAVFAVHVLEHLIDFLALVDECHRVLRPGGVLHVVSPWWRYVNAVADPTHVRLLDVQTIKGICQRPDAPRWYPLHAGCDAATIFGDLMAIGPDDPGPDEAHLARFFD